jgi:VanZ family protein
MPALIRRILSYKFLPLSWTIFTILLLCLPGSMVPGTGIFSIKNLDKIAHVILFGVNVLLWGWHYATTGSTNGRLRLISLSATVSMVILGVVMEYVQLYFIPNRSFDVWDIAADAAGSVLAGLWLLRV